MMHLVCGSARSARALSIFCVWRSQLEQNTSAAEAAGSVGAGPVVWHGRAVSREA